MGYNIPFCIVLQLFFFFSPVRVSADSPYEPYDPEDPLPNLKSREAPAKNKNTTADIDLSNIAGFSRKEKRKVRKAWKMKKTFAEPYDPEEPLPSLDLKEKDGQGGNKNERTSLTGKTTNIVDPYDPEDFLPCINKESHANIKEVTKPVPSLTLQEQGLKNIEAHSSEQQSKRTIESVPQDPTPIDKINQSFQPIQALNIVKELIRIIDPNQSSGSVPCLELKQQNVKQDEAHSSTQQGKTIIGPQNLRVPTHSLNVKKQIFRKSVPHIKRRILARKLKESVPCLDLTSRETDTKSTGQQILQKKRKKMLAQTGKVPIICLDLTEKESPQKQDKSRDVSVPPPPPPKWPKCQHKTLKDSSGYFGRIRTDPKTPAVIMERRTTLKEIHVEKFISDADLYEPISP